MSNVYLLVSSIFFGSLQIILISVLQPANTLLVKNITIGIITSAINNGTTSTIVKYMDRIVMIFCLIIDIHICLDMQYQYKNNCIALLLMSVSSYISSKYIMYLMEFNDIYYLNLSNFSHIISHILLTINHSIMIEYYSQYKNIKLK